ncbi:MAG: lysophospholipid acyltransferase family protein [Candidatus Riflebacteria bacterium]|nr:lysophospholipid acyltransferase family protein [Candidatus Riflebacteria bacterium]
MKNKSLKQMLEAYLLEKLIHATQIMGEAGQRKIAVFLKILAFDILRIRRTYVIETLKERLNISINEAKKIAEKTYFNFFFNSITMATLSFGSKNKLLSAIRVRGFENFAKAYEKGRGVIILSGHFGLWELIPQWFSANGYQMTSVIRRQTNLQVDEIMERMRRNHGALTTDSGYGIRDILKTLKSGKLLGLMMDQNAGDKGIFVDFLGKPASTVPGPAMVSAKTGSPLVLVIVQPGSDSNIDFKILPPIYPDQFPNNSEGRTMLTSRYTDLFCDIIKKRPEQWFWLHRRWKSVTKRNENSLQSQ